MSREPLAKHGRPTRPLPARAQDLDPEKPRIFFKNIRVGPKGPADFLQYGLEPKGAQDNFKNTGLGAQRFRIIEKMLGPRVHGLGPKVAQDNFKNTGLGPQRLRIIEKMVGPRVRRLLNSRINNLRSSTLMGGCFAAFCMRPRQRCNLKSEGCVCSFAFLQSLR